MKPIHVALAGAALSAAFGAGVLAQQRAGAPAQPPVTGTIAPMPDNLKPTRISGSGITVADLAGMKAWYETVLNMHVVATYPAGSDNPYEYILATSPQRGEGAVLALIRGQRQPGATTYGRLILNVPNADAAAEYLRTHGVAARRVAAGAYFITDPEGNSVELYTPPAPSAGA